MIIESPRQTCFERLLALDQVVPPPARLTQFFQEREPEYLIRTYLRYDMVSTALDYTLTLVDEVRTSHFGLFNAKKPCSLILVHLIRGSPLP